MKKSTISALIVIVCEEITLLTPYATPPPLKVAIYRTSSIGDVVLATSCLDLLERLGMPLDVTWAGRHPSLGLIASAWPALRPIEVKRAADSSARDNLVAELGKAHIVIDLQANLRSRHACLMAKRENKAPYYTCEKMVMDRSRMVLMARIRGRARALVSEQVTPQHRLMSDTLRMALGDHLPVEMRDLIAGYDPAPRLPTEHDPGHRPWQKELKFGRWLAVAPGALYDTKRSPLQVFQGILEELRRQWARQKVTDERGVGLLLLGDERDRNLTLQLLDRIQWPFSVLNLAGKLSLWETALALKDAEALLGNDSSLCHIAEAVGTPVVAMFGPTIEAFGFAPWRANSVAVSAPLGCRPCSKHGDTACRYNDQLCFQMIPVFEVARHIFALLAGESVAPA